MLALESSAGSSEARDAVTRKYRSLLVRLTNNSKQRINALTTLAKRSKHFTKDIVSLIEAQIAKAPPTQKLPVLYLLDSIIKNVGGGFVPTFAKNLQFIFPSVYEEADANTKKCLFRLRSTWNGLFPRKKLLVLDIRVNAIDPSWSIKSLPANLDFSDILAKSMLPRQSEQESTTSDSEREAKTTENCEKQSLSPRAEGSLRSQDGSSLKRRAGSLSPSSPAPKVRKVSFVSAHPGSHAQAQHNIPHPGSCVEHPEGAGKNRDSVHDTTC